MDRLEPQAQPGYGSDQYGLDRPERLAGSADAATPPGDYGAATPPGGFDAWRYRSGILDNSTDVVGYKVHASDGDIGKVDEASNDVDASFLVVDTGPWIFGRKVLIPAGTVSHIDHGEGRIHLDLTKEQVKASPEIEPHLFRQPGYRDKVGDYYVGLYGPGSPGVGPAGGVFPPAVPPDGPRHGIR